MVSANVIRYTGPSHNDLETRKWLELLEVGKTSRSKDMAETHIPLEQLEQDRVDTIAGTLQPKPITTRIRSRPVRPRALAKKEFI